MKEHEYVQGKKAQEIFEQGMKAIFKVPKEKVVKAEKKRKHRASTVRKPTNSD